MGDFGSAPGQGILPVVRHFACGSGVGECPIAFVGFGFAKSLGGWVPEVPPCPSLCGLKKHCMGLPFAVHQHDEAKKKGKEKQQIQKV